MSFMNTTQWQFTTTNQPIHTSVKFGATKEYLLIGVFSSIILSMALFCVYMYWIRRRGQTHHLSPSRTDVDSQPPGTLMTQPSLGLGDEGIDNLPVSLHRSSLSLDKSSNKNAATECCICLDVFEDEERIKVLPSCRHTYHSDCVDLWLGSQSSCPLCRISLKDMATSTLDPPDALNNV